MNLRRILLGIILGLTIYSLLNLFIDVPFSALFSSLAIVCGIVSIFLLYTDTHKSDDESISNIVVVLVVYWIISFLSIMTGFASIYLDLARQNPNHFAGIADGISALYFSVGTFATVGYGDIYPVSSIAKSLVMSQIFVAIIILPAAIGTSVNHRIKQKAKEATRELNNIRHNELKRIK